MAFEVVEMALKIFLMEVVQMEVVVEALTVVVKEMKVVVEEKVVGTNCYCYDILVLAYLSIYLIFF